MTEFPLIYPDAGEPPFVYPADYIHAGNCGLMAMAIATGKPLEEVTEWFRVKEKRRANWAGTTWSISYGAFLSYAGVWANYTRYNKRERVRTVGDFA